jgi:hypothetical protein
MALKGFADAPPVGNCDGIVTDEEARRFVAGELARNANDDWATWRIQPTAVLKRSVDFALPVSRSQSPGACAAPDWPAVRRSLPAALHEPLMAQRRFLTGTGPAPTGPLRFLVVTRSGLSDAEFDLPTFLKRGAQLAQPRGWQVVDGTASQLKDLKQALRSASFLHALVLDVSRSPFGDVFVELRSPRESAARWADALAPSSAEQVALVGAEAVARRLSGRFELFSVRVAGERRLIVRVRGELPKKVSAIRWEQFVNGVRQGRHIALAGLDPAPCPGAVGQCFFLSDETAKQLAKDYEAWVVIH